MRIRAFVIASLALVAWSVSAPRAGAETLFGMTDTGELFASTNSGTTWTPRSTLPVNDAVSLLAGETSSHLYLASESGSIYRSSDAGVSWNAVGAVAASDVAALVPRPGRFLLLTRSGSVFSSTDAGATFDAVGAITASDVVGAASLNKFAYALTRAGAIYRSSDEGVTWSPIGTLPFSDGVGIATFANRLHVLTSTGDVARSEDSGATWSFVATLSQSGMTALLGGAADLVAATAEGEVAGSADGIGWSWRGTINQMTLRALANDQPYVTAVGGPRPTASIHFTLGPSPAREAMTLAFDLDHEAIVTVTVHDVAGRIVARPIANESLPAGATRRRWSPTLPSPGIYLVRALVADRVVTRRLVWLGGL